MTTNTNSSDDAGVAHVKPPFAQVADAIRKLLAATGTQVGVDCLKHAQLAQALLAKLGFDAVLKVGYAAWRVGPGDGDVIAHAPVRGMVPQGPAAVAAHAWVECHGVLFDPTLYQIPMKARAMDQLDGGSTAVTWAPPYLVLDRHQVQTLAAVTRTVPGACYYEHDPAAQDFALSRVPGLDDQEVALLALVYNNPEAHVIGPNQMLCGSALDS